MTSSSGWSGWSLALYPDAAEAGASFQSVSRERREGGVPDPERSRAEAARRARSKLRRYCAANRLNRLGTLTYAGEGCHDPRAIRRDLGEFFRGLRAGLGGRPLPYAWVPEWHKTDHGLHAHFAVGRYVPRRQIERSWGRGFVHIKLIGDLPVGTGSLAEARRAAGYLCKYIGKGFDDERRVAGLHRYEVAQGFQPRVERIRGRSASVVVNLAAARMGSAPERIFRSEQIEGYEGPPWVWVAWAG